MSLVNKHLHGLPTEEEALADFARLKGDLERDPSLASSSDFRAEIINAQRLVDWYIVRGRDR